MMTFKITEFDATIRHIAEYVADAEFADISDRTCGALVRHHLDSIGCSIGGYQSPVCRTAVAIASSAVVPAGASVIGLADRTTPEYAAFANATLIRFLDYNDNYLRNGGGHTSDLIPAPFAAAELGHRSGSDLLVGLHVGYEVFAALADAIRNRDRGWDYPFFIGIAAAAATARVMALPVEQVANAISLAITPSLPFGITRVGPLANWKGLASSYATMNAYFVTRLASRGITGPPAAIEGHRGMQQLASGAFDLSSLGQPQDGLTAAERSSYKLYVAEFNAQGPVAFFAQLHRRGIGAEDIESVEMRTYEVAWSEIGGGQDDHDIKWDPQNKETADHSLPYMVSRALVDGDVTADSYATDRVRDPRLRPLMNKISVVVDEAITAAWDVEPAHEIAIRFVDGTTEEVRIPYPKGHPSNPAGDDDLVRKFRSQSVPVIGDGPTEELLAALWSLPDIDDIASLADRYRSLRIEPC